MRVFNLSRNEGKTLRMLYASEFTGATILCLNERRKENVLDMAKHLNIKIPEPITVEKLTIERNSDRYMKDILVDDSLEILQSLFRRQGLNIIGCTINNDDENDDERE